MGRRKWTERGIYLIWREVKLLNKAETTNRYFKAHPLVGLNIRQQPRRRGVMGEAKAARESNCS